MATKSDVKAKKAFIAYLEKQGYTSAKIISQPADIVAWKDGEMYYFEIKMTRQKKTYFGAATLTEWAATLENPGHYFFVIAVTDENETNFRFIIMTPEEFMMYSTIPPIKIFFNFPLKNDFGNNETASVDYPDEETINSIINRMQANDQTTASKKSNKKKNGAVWLSPENLKKLIAFFNELKNNQ